MRLIVAESAPEFAEIAVGVVAGVLGQNPRAVLAMPTGTSPIGMYERLVAEARAARLSLGAATVFNLDELVGLDPEHTESYTRFMRERLVLPAGVGCHYSPDGLAPDPEAEARRYEHLTAAAGGFDLAVLGLGANGHIAFNEPGAPPDCRTRVITLAADTRASYTNLFGSLDGVPTHAITVGLANLLEARQILMLVRGSGKGKVLAEALQGPVSPALPASVLQRHPDVTVVVMADVAAEAAFGQHPRLT